MSMHYKKAGVDIDAGNHFIDLIKPAVKSTHKKGVIDGIGGFAGLFSLDLSNYKKPVLVSSTDGVGTKLLLAQQAGKLGDIGSDLVAMCVNDVACCGAETLFFLDYFATGKLEPHEHAPIIGSIAVGCQKAGCALVGGETAEMPGLYKEKDFDLAGFAVGIVDEEQIIDGSKIGPSHAIIGVASSGFHSNGYSLIRHFINERNINLEDKVPNTNDSWAQRLLAPTRIYSPLMHKLARNYPIGGMAHITGGGFWDNIPRVLPLRIKAVIDRRAWPWPEELKQIMQMQDLGEDEALKVFNCGIGLVIIAPKDQTDDIVCLINGSGEKAFIIGETAKAAADEPNISIK